MHAKKLVRFRLKSINSSVSCTLFRLWSAGTQLLRCSLPRRITSFCILARGVRGSTNERESLTEDGALVNEGSCIALKLKVWKAQIERADKLFGSLSSEEVLREIK